MSNKSGESNFIEFIKKQRWLLPVLLVVFLLLLGSMMFFSDKFALTPFIYQKF